LAGGRQTRPISTSRLRFRWRRNQGGYPLNGSPGAVQTSRATCQLEDVFKMLGSNVNPILTQLAKTRRAVFVEGKDFLIFSRFARKVGRQRVSGRSDFAVVPIEGFNPERARNLKAGMETTLGVRVAAAAILDRDYRSEPECAAVIDACGGFCDFAVIHSCKEIENFLLVPAAIDRAVRSRLKEREMRTGEKSKSYIESAEGVLLEFAESRRIYVTGQYQALRRRFEREAGSGLNDEVLLEKELKAFEARWADPQERVKMIPGKEALTNLNSFFQDNYQVSITPTAVIEAMRTSEVPPEMTTLIERLANFSTGAV
jgi:hypothetical protein